MRVLVTGVADHLGGQLARRLEARDDVTAIFGIDIKDPEVALDRTEFVHADTRHSLLTKLVRGLQVDTVVHCAVLTEGQEPNRVVHETNVIGTMNLLAACSSRDSSVRRVVIRSSVAVYGCHPYAPSFVREESAGREPAGEFLGDDLLEMEQLAWDFALRRRDVATTTLRFGHGLGLGTLTALGRYFRLSRIPTFVGFDPRIQLLHEEDAVEMLYRAAVADHPGVFNVAGDGVLLLSQAVRVAGRPKLSVLFPYTRVVARTLLRATGFEMPAYLADFLTYGCVVDCARLERQFGWRPAHTTRDTLAAFAGADAALPPAALGPQEYELSQYLQRRRRAGRPVHVLK